MRIAPFVLPLLVLAVSGCSTLTAPSTQRVSIQAIDEQGRNVAGLSCRVRNAAADYVGVTPLFDLQVQRSASPLLVECRRGDQPATVATLEPRATELEVAQALLPGGSAMLVVDHLSGSMYSYPRWVQLRIGQTMSFDRRDDAGRGPTPGFVVDPYERFVQSGPAASNSQ